jgi:hypothetical protein
VTERPAPVFDQVNIVSGDTEASVHFYRKLGLRFPITLSGGRRAARTISPRKEVQGIPKPIWT